MKHLIIFILLTFLAFSCSYQGSTKKEIKKPEYSIGYIDAYSDGSEGRPAIGYHYKAGGIKESNDYPDTLFGKKWHVPAKMNYHEQDKFMVEYDATETGSLHKMMDFPTSRMLFDYPVKDSADFKKYIEMFKTKRPE